MGERSEMSQPVEERPTHHVVLGPDSDGVQHLLLVQYGDSGQWGLPREIVDAAEDPNAPLILNGSGVNVDLRNTPSRQLGSSQGSDVAALTILPGKLWTKTHPPELLDAKWFELGPDSRSLPTVGLLPGHDNHILDAANLVRLYNDSMRAGQVAYARGDTWSAGNYWKGAEGILPDTFSRGVARRGRAEAADRIGDAEVAAELAGEAFSLHESTRSLIPNSPRDVRERAKSEAVLGRILLRGVVTEELGGRLSESEARQQAGPAMERLRHAHRELEDLELWLERVEQYKVDLLSQLAIGESLYGDRAVALQRAHEAIRKALRSEGRKVEGAVNLYPGYRWQSRAAAVMRGIGALSVYDLATPVFEKRPKALRRALARRLGL